MTALLYRCRIRTANGQLCAIESTPPIIRAFGGAYVMPHSIKKNSYVLVLDLKNLIQLPSHTVRPLPAVEESQIHCPLNNDRLIHPDALE